METICWFFDEKDGFHLAHSRSVLVNLIRLAFQRQMVMLSNTLRNREI